MIGIFHVDLLHIYLLRIDVLNVDILHIGFLLVKLLHVDLLYVIFIDLGLLHDSTLCKTSGRTNCCMPTVIADMIIGGSH